MLTKGNFNQIFGIFHSCCASGSDGKQDLYDFEIDEHHFKDRLANCVDIVVLLEDGSKLACTLHVNCQDNLIRIACDRQVREIKFKSVKKILHTKEELSRVQTNGCPINYGTTVAFHLVENGNCIPLSFNNTHEKKLFLNILSPYILV
ncbi:hypothetical protein BEWA_033650 [Theileria equi strain WA]|uniref:ISP1 C-terminal domain-containing protein n=1 Tax=Theileria equi strain WA TaxID=1537102 RepID=L0AY73_THEEQ|nr:hypothetical protein BEWA_033650 [Theileria equi strain WA]AFZ80510.1 hypothetical protein BEWA_033650 [Theileria equi strain WA]|eukprot:XP_004830176.1 hypothetical protein BEWA_033650 [Theileria equi strain WA]